MNELQDFKLDDLYEKLALDEDEFDDFLVTLGLLHGSMNCTRCHQPMKLQRGSHGSKVWRCLRAVHRPERPKIGYKNGTIFHSAHLTTKQAFKLSYFWAMGHSKEYARFETGLSKDGVCYWYKQFREVCSNYFRANPVVLGGPNIDVELDETFMTRKHAGRGRQVRRNKKWVFCMIERGSGYCHCEIVPRRDTATLLPIILRHIAPGARILSDEWRVYRILGRFAIYRHKIVNHGVSFVDPTDATVHTQGVENLNGRWKLYVRKKQGIKDGQLRRHLAEFMWRQRFGKRSRVFYYLWSHVATMFPCQR